MYIDDIRDPKGEFDVIARTSNEAIDWMFANETAPNFISFDFDLGGDDRAIDVAKFMVSADMDLGGEFIPEDFTFFVHSANPEGARQIQGYLDAYLGQRD